MIALFGWHFLSLPAFASRVRWKQQQGKAAPLAEAMPRVVSAKSSTEPFTEGPACWICLDDHPSELIQPCSCPRHAHRKCLARWQLQKSGSLEESTCRFCSQELPSWQEAYSLCDNDASQYISMGIRVDGRIVIVKARRGPDGVAEFERKVRDLLGYPQDVELDFTFSCSAPDATDAAPLRLEGLHSYETAMHCAQVAARQRKSAMPA